MDKQRRAVLNRLNKELKNPQFAMWTDDGQGEKILIPKAVLSYLKDELTKAWENEAKNRHRQKSRKDKTA